MHLTGVLLQAVDAAGRPTGPVWHTARGGGRPLGFTRWPPPGVRGIPFGNAETGEIAIPLLHGTHLTTLFWQFLPGEFPPAMVLNLYFDGDNVSPKISAFVPLRWGLTHFAFNSAPGVLSLSLEEVPNQAELFFDSGLERARLGAAFYFSSERTWQGQWRPSDYVDLDRVGVDRLAPDGNPDGIFIFELIVEPSPGPAQRRRPIVGLFPRRSLEVPLPVRPREPAPPLGWESPGAPRYPRSAPESGRSELEPAESMATPNAETPAATGTPAGREPAGTAPPTRTPNPAATSTEEVPSPPASPSRPALAATPSPGGTPERQSGSGVPESEPIRGDRDATGPVRRRREDAGSIGHGTRGGPDAPRGEPRLRDGRRRG